MPPPRYNRSMSVPVVPSPATHGDILLCTVCATANVASARFCASCGARLLFFCWSCGTVAQVGQQFCQTCGAGLALPQAGAPHDALAHPTHQLAVVGTVVAPPTPAASAPAAP